MTCHFELIVRRIPLSGFAIRISLADFAIMLVAKLHSNGICRLLIYLEVLLPTIRYHTKVNGFEDGGHST